MVSNLRKVPKWSEVFCQVRSPFELINGDKGEKIVLSYITLFAKCLSSLTVGKEGLML